MTARCWLLAVIVGSACAAQAQTTTACDVNGDGSTNISDVQAIVRDALGAGSSNGDLNNDGVANVTDVQIVIGAVLGGGCSADGAISYALTVVNGTGAGNYFAGALVNIIANAPGAGQAFLNWTGATVADATSSSTVLTMPTGNVTVTANFSAAPPPASCANMSLGDNAGLNGFVPFPSNAAWNADISAAPLDPNNTAITSAAGFAGLHLHHDFSSVAGGNYGIPYVVVDSTSTALAPINVIDYACESDVAMAPFPLTAPIEGSPADCDGWPDTYVGDSHVLVLDRHACMLYETFNTHRCSGAWNSSSETPPHAGLVSASCTSYPRFRHRLSSDPASRRAPLLRRMVPVIRVHGGLSPLECTSLLETPS